MSWLNNINTVTPVAHLYFFSVHVIKDDLATCLCQLYRQLCCGYCHVKCSWTLLQFVNVNDKLAAEWHLAVDQTEVGAAQWSQSWSSGRGVA